MGFKTKAKDDIQKRGGAKFDDDWPPEGHYQFLVTDIEVQPERMNNMIIVSLETVTGTVPGQEDKTPALFLWYDEEHKSWNDNCMDRIIRFFWACGLIEPGEEKEIEPLHCRQKSFVGKVIKGKRKLKSTGETIEALQMADGQYWRIGDPEIKDLFETKELAPPPKAREEKPSTEDDGLDDL